MIGFPRWHGGKESACQYRRFKRCGFDPRVRKIPWSRKWQRTPVLLPGNPMNRGAYQATVHGVTKRQTQLSNFPHTIYDHGRNFGKYTKEIRKHKQPESLAETLKKRLASYFFPSYCREIFYDLIIVM